MPMPMLRRCRGPAVRALGVLAVTLGMALQASSAAAGRSDRVWRSLESDHFVVHFYEPHEDLGRRVAVVAERAHRVLSPALEHAPRGKTHIVITDDTDGANGFAQVSPRNLIHLFATAPDEGSSLGDHDDWLYGLVAHEYSHILHLDTVSGLPKWWNRVFGKVWMPNQIQPRWFIEGLATYEESKRSSAGRVRSAIFDMYLRAAVLAGSPLRLDEISAGYLRFPHSNSVYLYGSHFLGYVADRYGDQAIAEMSHAYAGHPIPWNMGRAARQAVGKNFDELYQEWRTHLAQKYALQADVVRRRGLVEGRRVTRTGEGNAVPRFSPDGKRIAWLRSDGKTRARYRIMATGADASASQDLAVLDGGAFAFLPDGSGLVLERTMTYRSDSSYRDLFRYDFATQGLTRLTHGLRASAPDVSPDGREVAFVQNGGSRSRLAAMPLRPGASPRVLWQGPDRFDQAAAPAWSPDGRRIAFAAWTKGGYRDLYVHDLEEGTTTRLMDDRAHDGDPRWSPDGRWIYFSSDRTGIYNLYAIEPGTRRLRQVTNVLGGAFDLDVSPDGRRIVYSGFVAEGYELFDVSVEPARWLEPQVYVSDRPDPVEIRDDEAEVSPSRPYRAIETLAPDYWRAELTVDSFGSALSATTSGADVAGIHAYSLGTTVGFERGDVSFAGSYAYDRLFPLLRLSVGRGIARRGGLIVDNRNTAYTEEGWALRTLAVLPVLRRPEVSSDVSFSYDVDWLRNIDGVPPLDPTMPVPRLPEDGVIAGLSLRWSLSTVRGYTYTLGPTEGRALGTTLRLNHPKLGSDFESLELLWRWQEYLPMPWPGGHILSLRYAGGLEQTRRRNDGLFALGATPKQDVVDSIVNSTRVGTTGVLRGYVPFSLRGRQFHLLNAEYRVPVWNIEAGPGLLPIFARRLHVAGLLDVGNAFSGPFEPDELRVAVGASLRLDLVFGFYEGGTLDLGFARGLSKGGQDEAWLLLTHVL